MVRRAVGAIIIAVIGIGGIALAFMPRQSAAQPALEGTNLRGISAPDVHLKDQFGHPVSLSEFRGRVVAMTFLRSNCKETCPVVAEDLRRTVAQLGAGSRNVVLLAVSTDPEGDTPQAVRAFSKRHGLLHRWHYLIGSRQQLNTVWHAYYIYAAPAGAPVALQDNHTSATYLIDTTGHERVLLTGALDGSEVDRDLRILAGLPISPTGTSATPAPEADRPEPDFTLAALQGSALHLGSLRGKVVLLNFWATWCHPCRQEMPRLSRWYKQLQSKGLVVVGVDQQESSADVQRFTSSLHVPYPIALDSNAVVSAEYHVIGLPTTFLIDREGIIRSVQLGMVDDAFLATRVKPLVDAG